MKALIRKNFILAVLVIVLAALATIPSWFFYTRYQAAKLELSNPTVAAKAQSQEVIKKIGALMLLPKDETPTVATVNDPSKLTSQPFFAGSAKGDILVLYTGTAKRAILYRPSTNLIINVAPLSIGNNNQSNVIGAETQALITFDLRNGTTIVGLAGSYENELLKKLPTAKVIEKSDTKSNYKNSLLIDNAAGGSGQAASISAAIGIPLGKLPAGEALSKAQFILILGADQK